MEITMEEEMNIGKSNSDSINEIERPKVIAIYPYDDEEWHLTYVVKPEDFDCACELLNEAYEFWDRNRYEEAYTFDDLESICADSMDMLFSVKFRYLTKEEDPFPMDEMI